MDNQTPFHPMEDPSDKEFLQNLVAGIYPRKFYDGATSGKASVSVIMRFTPFSLGLEYEPSHLSFEQFMSVPSLLHDELQILFIKRTVRPTDRWSGHVAFPGGKVEPNETRKDCAVRETQEEIGVDLSDLTHFHYVGDLGEWPTINNMLVSAFCWIQINPAELKFNLQKTEVHSTNWVPISYFKNVTSSPVLSHTNFPPEEETETKYPGVLLPTTLVSPIDLAKDVKYILWGLTFAITCFILKIGGLKMNSLKKAIEEGTHASRAIYLHELHAQPKL